MITQPPTRHRRCHCCQTATATRTALDRPGRDGSRREIWLCGKCPDPETIDRLARKIALSWSEREMAARVYGCPITHVDHHRAVYYDRVCELA